MRETVIAGLAAAVIVVVALMVYIPTAAQGLIYGGGVESESAQLQRVANRLGIAHSTGYPLHTLIGYGAARLAEALDADPYTAITYTSTVAVVLGLVGFFFAAHNISSRPAALGATAMLAVTDTVWHIATITETQALHFACMAAIWWGITAHLKWPDRLWPLAVIALGSGVGLANHRTIIFSIGAAAVVIALGWVWRTWGWRRWAILIGLTLLPVLSYGYLFVRVQDPHVVYSTRPTWFPAQIDNGVIVDLMRGTLQSGEGLEGNLVVPRADAEARLQLVRDNVQADIGAWWLGLGMVGWVLIGLRYPRLLLAGVLMAAAWIVFLMSWRLDWKAVIYQHALLLLAALGWSALFAAPAYLPPAILHKRPWLAHPVVMAVLGVPLLLAAWGYYADHHAARDLSADDRGQRLYAQLDALPPDAFFQTGGWTPDTFIVLEYLDESGRTDVLPLGAEPAEVIAQRALTQDRPVMIGPFLRGFFGLYSGSLFFQERGLSFSGTTGPDLFQIRRPDDPALADEAATATVINAPLAPEVTLMSVRIIPQAGQFVLVLYWRAESTPMPHYSVFTHLREYGVACDESTLRRLIVQDDSYGPVRNIHPTTVWQTGEIVKDTYFIAYRESLPEGAALVVGLTANGQRVGDWCTPAP